MLSDPLSVTYDGSGMSLPRTGGTATGFARRLMSSRYATSDGEFYVNVDSFLMTDNAYKVEIQLSRVTPDPDDPFTGNYRRLPNSFGLTYTVNDLNYATSTDIPLLRTALLALVDTTLQGRLIAREV
jgi:hypothetical protein